MKQIIDRRVYDTETAERIGEHRFSDSSDFHGFKEALYRTKKEQFFIAGSGGPMSAYAVTIGQNQWARGSKIRLLSNDEAYEWCEVAGLETAVIAQYFTVEEG